METNNQNLMNVNYKFLLCNMLKLPSNIPSFGSENVGVEGENALL
jgi:hypothetical protein